MTYRVQDLSMHARVSTFPFGKGVGAGFGAPPSFSQQRSIDDNFNFFIAVAYL